VNHQPFFPFHTETVTPVSASDVIGELERRGYYREKLFPEPTAPGKPYTFPVPPSKETPSYEVTPVAPPPPPPTPPTPPAPPAPPPEEVPEVRRKFPWWIVAAGVVGLMLLRK